MVTLTQSGTDESQVRSIKDEQKQSPGWFGAKLADKQVVLLTKDFWHKCPKETKISPSGINYYAWPRHGELGEADDRATRPELVYKFQCFHVGKLLDSRLPSEYFTALQSQTDTTECKAEYARAANMSGVAIHNEFALAFLPSTAQIEGRAADDYFARLQQLYEIGPIARVSPTAIAESGVLGPVAALDRGFPAAQATVRDGMLGYAHSIDRYGDYGWAIYGNTHHDEFMNPAAAGVPGGRPSLHRVWSNNHYQHVSTSWRLNALSGDEKLLHWARTCTDYYASIGQVRYDAQKGRLDGKGARHEGSVVKFHVPGAFWHCKAFVPWGGRDYGMDANGHPQNIYCRSDHYEYARYGIPIVFMTTGGHADYHEVTDEPQYIDYAHLAATPGTLVIFMGLKRLGYLADNLIFAGRDVDEPAAVISKLSYPDSQTCVGTLGTIAAVARGLESPSLVIVGDVVASSAHLQAAVEQALRAA